MTDLVRRGFLRKQADEGFALARESDVLELVPFHGDPPDAYLAIFRCRGLVFLGAGEPEIAERFVVGIRFPEEYLRRVEPQEIVTLLEPVGLVFHPNVLGPVVCVGHIGPGTPLADILDQVHAILTYQKFNVADCLNPLAADWARRNSARFPIDPRPLRRAARAPRVRIARREAAS